MNTNKKYKDRLFRFIFSDKKSLLDLYNAINGSSYTGITPCHVGALPLQCAALNQTNINVHNLAIAATLTGQKSFLYQAAMLDPHTSAELSLDDIRAMCDELLAANREWICLE